MRIKKICSFRFFGKIFPRAKFGNPVFGVVSLASLVSGDDDCYIIQIRLPIRHYLKPFHHLPGINNITCHLLHFIR
jgi:hypothetical protein